MDAPPGFDDVIAAAARIAGHVVRTPVVTSRTLDREIGAEVFFKTENLQKTGSYKARGATNAVLSLPDDAAAGRGVVSHSSGNHAAALAYAAGIRGIRCHVVMPEASPPIKVAAARDFGAEVRFCGTEDREEACARLQEETGAILVHPYDHPAVIAGQATVALELVGEVPDLDAVVAPIGGGGLLAGTALVLGCRRPSARAIGGEPEAADDAYRSLTTGVRQPRVPGAATIADGLLGGIGRIPFEMLTRAGAQVVTVTDAQIRAAGRFHLERMKLVVEPSAAVALAALRLLAPHLAGRRVGLIVSGGNTDLRWL